MQQERDTYQVKQVQGPQLHGQEPRHANVIARADLTEKYLGRGMIGFGPALEVLSNRSADELLQTHGYDLYRKMLMDSKIDSSIDTLIQSAASQPIHAIPNSRLRLDDDGYQQSLELSEFVNYVLGRLPMENWRREQTRTMLAFGNAVSEMDWEWLESGKWAGHFVVKALRQQRPEDYGFVVDRWGEIYGVAPLGQATGMLFPLGNLIPLTSYGTKLLEGMVPRYKLTVWQWEQKGVDPRGTSVLIPAYIPWWSKQRAIEEWACWLGRYAQPSLWATPGPDAVPICITLPDGSQIITQPTEALLQALLQFKSASVLALPYGSELNLIQASGSAEPFLSSISAFNQEIQEAILGEAIASKDSTTKASDEVKALVLRQYINSIRRFIAKQIQVDIIKPLIEANYGDVGDLLPEIDLGDGDGWPPTVTEIAVLMQSGYFSVDQLPKLDRILGVPVRETEAPAGPAAASAYYKLQQNDTKPKSD